MLPSKLIGKYNIPGPRYTSYPTVPYWDDKQFSLKGWKSSIVRSFNESNTSEGISLYIHLPFCESLCTFCGCNKRITKNHGVEIPYIRSVIREWEMYCDLLEKRPLIKELHLGGGTPTFFSAENLSLLINGIFSLARKSEDAELSFEGHPNNTTLEHLETLASLGFSRVSYGVQDYNTKVQQAIHRIQPFDNVKSATENARKAGFSSVGHDIIFGLPFQTKEDIIHTINRTKELMPDRIAFYSYAHVPWIKGNGQRGFKDEDLPGAEEKREQYETGKQMLLEAGYVEIGMDHFALRSDSLFRSVENKTIHRNFMGYTSSKTQAMIGLGVSAISDSWYGFAQNVKGVEEYEKLVNDGIFPVFRGHLLTEEDLIIRKHILNLMCKFKTSWYTRHEFFTGLPDVLISLREMQNDGLIEIDSNYLVVTEKGRPFVRNICMAFDLRLQRNKPETKLFSMTV
ncbi:oxygen-independent coproporphyrinogen-3 oxidase [Christiangramia gaetbulicola]|uniref:Coproporphyrinogen-III oxidase n=1 Tax=Christiangramia gaetbulicola TaxID=703340 RepID=A0A2T6ACT8_9FLAO|nr:oxygen-independent coproporphyrinogen III oxidase [Christiangramia gaetbulicola]PTX41635.1 oxygen-independent coproporphyrinogen-3 oxidase [Christiangramia gaetbulicola]